MPRRQSAARRDKANLRTRLAELRDASGARQQDLADALGLSLNTYRKLEAGGYQGEEPIGMLVNAAMALGVDPMLLIEPHLDWHIFRPDRTNPPLPGAVHPGVPPETPGPGSATLDQQLELTTTERELLRKLVALDDQLDGGAVFSWAPERDGDLLEIQALPAGGRQRNQRRPEPVYATRAALDGLIDRGAINAQHFGLSLSAREYAQRRFSSKGGR